MPTALNVPNAQTFINNALSYSELATIFRGREYEPFIEFLIGFFRDFLSQLDNQLSLQEQIDAVIIVIDNLATVEVKETETLANGQTTVVFGSIDCTIAQFYLAGLNVSNGRLQETIDYTITNATTLELEESYPAGTVLLGVNLEVVG